MGLQRYLLRVCPRARSPSQGKTPQETPYKPPQMLLKRGLGSVLGGWDGPLAGFRGQVGTPMGQDEAKLAPRSDKLGPKWTKTRPSRSQNGPRWGQDAPSWGQVGPNWEPSWDRLEHFGAIRMQKCWFAGILAFPARKLVFLQENKGPERSLGGIRGYFWPTWEQKWLLEGQVGAKINSKFRKRLTRSSRFFGTLVIYEYEL